LGENIHSISKNTEALLVASRKVGLDVNVENDKRVFMSHQPNAVQNHKMKSANNFFENVAQFKYL
jgi:hypothetical protein